MKATPNFTPINPATLLSSYPSNDLSEEKLTQMLYVCVARIKLLIRISKIVPNPL